MLEIIDVSKQFGGITAVDQVSLSIAEHEIHAIIGPNGAGKTTLLSQLAGELKADEGSIVFRGQDITHLKAAQRAQAGLARSFQITSVFLPMTLLENVMLAVQAHRGHSFRFWRNARQDQAIVRQAMAVLEQLGLADRANRTASTVSHGEHRQLELAMALATEPKMLLLDEPTAGMGPEESGEMVKLLQGLKGSMTILLIEHDMDAVFSLAERISVLVYGRLIATGTGSEIRNNHEVQKAYLGES